MGSLPLCNTFRGRDREKAKDREGKRKILPYLRRAELKTKKTKLGEAPERTNYLLALRTTENNGICAVLASGSSEADYYEISLWFNYFFP